MDVIANSKQTQTQIRKLRTSGKSVGVVPTMGALHAGHLSLVEAARSQCDVVAATIFVNPTQFAPGEDFERYPRTLESDLKLCSEAGADIVFTPHVDEMYSPTSQTSVVVSQLTQMLEGASRPAHFDGVTTIVAKLLNITLPDRAYFGQKDFQQQLVIRQMVSDLNFPVEIVTCPIVRESDGLAMSSRNRYLSTIERQHALVINRSLEKTEQLASSGEQTATQLQRFLEDSLTAAEGIDLDYATIVDAATLLPIVDGSAELVALVAARVGATRLIDNRIFRLPD
jgi:pantoate--beta-alanine ligase